MTRATNLYCGRPTVSGTFVPVVPTSTVFQWGRYSFQVGTKYDTWWYQRSVLCWQKKHDTCNELVLWPTYCLRNLRVTHSGTNVQYCVGKKKHDTCNELVLWPTSHSGTNVQYCVGKKKHDSCNELVLWPTNCLRNLRVTHGGTKVQYCIFCVEVLCYLV
jgi:hypothetical protein